MYFTLNLCLDVTSLMSSEDYTNVSGRSREGPIIDIVTERITSVTIPSSLFVGSETLVRRTNSGSRQLESVQARSEKSRYFTRTRTNTRKELNRVPFTKLFTTRVSRNTLQVQLINEILDNDKKDGQKEKI